ncbi:MAG: ATP-dependent Clp protease proteolytic subunit [Candidatus Paceibacterota bacterium]|jgi:ATP-dependent protease ClpP protease subunit
MALIIKKTPPTAKVKKALMSDYLLDDVHGHRVNRQTFEIFIGGDPRHLEGHSDMDYEEPGVEYMMADRFDINLGVLSSIDPGRPVAVYMASCGGCFEAGMQMVGAILTCPNPVTIIATKWARSMTSIIPLAADKFVMRPLVKYMYHHGKSAFSGLDQEASTADIERRWSREVMMRIYTARLKSQGKYKDKSPVWIRAELDRLLKDKIDVWFTPDEAVEWGFADAVFTGNHDTLRATKKNLVRRDMMMNVLRQPVNIEVKVS